MESIKSFCRRCKHVSQGQVVASRFASAVINGWRCPRCQAPARDCRLEVDHIDLPDPDERDDIWINPEDSPPALEPMEDQVPAEGGEEEEGLWRAIDESMFTYQRYVSEPKGLDLGQIFALVCGRSDDASHYCGVCQEPAVGDEITRLPKCEHRYHKLCINPWLVSNNSCPVCRAKVV